MPKSTPRKGDARTKRLGKREAHRRLDQLEDLLNKRQRWLENTLDALSETTLEEIAFDEAFRRVGPRLAQYFWGFEHHGKFRRAFSEARRLTEVRRELLSKLRATPWEEIRQRIVSLKSSANRSAIGRASIVGLAGKFLDLSKQTGDLIDVLFASEKRRLFVLRNAYVALKAMSERYTDAMRKLFTETQNPLFAWLAYDQCRRAERSVPDWVLQYLDRGGEDIQSLLTTQKSSTVVLGKALGLGPGQRGQRKAVKELERALRDLHLAFAVQQRIKEGHKGYEAPGLVAQNQLSKLSEPTVRRAYQRFKKKIVMP